MPPLLSILFVILFASVAAGAQDTGHFVREDCGTISSPVSHATLCLQTTAAGNRRAGAEYLWNGSAWAASNTAYYADRMGRNSVDCTGATDSSRKLQAVIDAVPDESTIKFPLGCAVLLGSTIVIRDRVGITLESETRPTNGGAGDAPRFLWNAIGGTMFSIEHTDHPTFRGLVFKNNIGKSVDRFLDFDGNPVSHIGTQALVEYSSFNGSNTNNPNFIAISISDTALSNHEFYTVRHADFFCSATSASVRSNANGSITNGSKTLTCTDCKFVGADVGRRVRASYATGILDTTIRSVANATHAEMAAAAAASQTNTRIHIGEAYGTAIKVGNSANTKDHVFYDIRTTNCAKGFWIRNGSFDLSHYGGSSNDVDIKIESITEPSRIAYVTTENDLRGIEAASAGRNLSISQYRIQNANQLANGFIVLDGIVTFTESKLEYAPPKNGVVFADTKSGALTAVFINNNFLDTGGNRLTFAQLGFSAFVRGLPTVINCYGIAAADLDYDQSFFRNGIIGYQPGTIQSSKFGLKGIAEFTSAGATNNVGVLGQLNGSGSGAAVKGTTTGLGTNGTIANGIMVEADPGAITSVTNLYNFKATGPTSVSKSAADVYGLYIARQKITNVRTGWGIYQADSADKNYFAGPTQFGGGTGITKHISATASVDFGPIAATSCSALTIAASGASDGDTVSLGIPSQLASLTGVTFIGFVSAPNVVTVKACNVTTSASANPSVATIRADIWQH